MIYGYARVSTAGQARDGNSLEAQAQSLSDKGASRIFSDAYTGTSTDRPALTLLLDTVKEGDTVIVTKLDRIARNTAQGIELVESLLQKGVSVHVLNMGLIDNTPTGRLILHVMLAFAEFERDMIVTRTAEGKAIARQRPDYHEGRPRKDYSEFYRLYAEVEQGLMSVKDACTELGCSKSTWHRRVAECNHAA